MGRDPRTPLDQPSAQLLYVITYTVVSGCPVVRDLQMPGTEVFFLEQGSLQFPATFSLANLLFFASVFQDMAHSPQEFPSSK